MKAAQQARLKLRCPIILNRQPDISFPSGWFEIVFEMCAGIEDIAQQLRKSNKDRIFLPRIVFIEEHQGKLSCDLINANRSVKAIINDAVEKSASCCSVCGEAAKQFRIGRFLVTRCEQHHREEMHY
ncbi:hypothetical protein LCGC14_0670480 [marine sediment metagenome]|uniref:Uncharacterized protein n=1 Tax=marine sediment metagenome TaxID=412755 RepID=A0A0F9TZ58_9ZZZZ|nr:hypothetical protein [Methylophaga aminisulfidivorans]